MSKVKVVSRGIVEKELDLEYPIFLYFQGEFWDDEMVAVINENCKITIKHDISDLKVIYENKFVLDDYLVTERNITTRRHFEESYKEAMDTINNKLSML